jgi:hypothetical protein
MVGMGSFASVLPPRFLTRSTARPLAQLAPAAIRAAIVMHAGHMASSAVQWRGGAKQIGGIAPYRLGKGVTYIAARETDIGQHAIIHTGEDGGIGRLRKVRKRRLAP